ncbi:AMP-binding protein [Vibrio harveyi]|nr:AMP-binding protein [Vibrio harveyi]
MDRANHSRDCFEASVSISPNHVALVDGERQWTYQSLLEHVDKLAAGFQSTLNLKSGDKVVLHLPNIGEFYISFFALLKIGVQPVLALPAHRYSEIRYFCHFTQAKALITAPQLGVDTADIALQVASELPSLKNIVWAGDMRAMPIGSVALRALLLDNVEPQVHRGEDFAFFQLSGGKRLAHLSLFLAHITTIYTVCERAMRFANSRQIRVTFVFYLPPTISH